MGKIFCVMGKSASGKDRIYRELMGRKELPLTGIVPYTTRPVRQGETPGKEYMFCDEAKLRQLSDENKIVELRAYNTVHGVWKYFTVDDGQIDLSGMSYLYIVTLEGYQKIREYFGAEHVVPVYIEADDGERLRRALKREQKQPEPRYEEMCRRFLADAEDFSEEKLLAAGIERRFVNMDLEETLAQVSAYIRQQMSEQEADDL